MARAHHRHAGPLPKLEAMQVASFIGVFAVTPASSFNPRLVSMGLMGWTG